LIEKAIGNIGEISRASQGVGQLPEPHLGVELVKGRVK
jgi:hypothetical protein